MEQQGTKANTTGSQLEVAVKTVLSGKGFEVLNYKTWDKNRDSYGKELLLENAPFTTIYNHKGSTEFLLLSEKHTLQMRIECKWQQVSGSVDEKLPYLYLNCVEAMPESTILILIDGPGWKAGAIQWLKDAVKNGKYLLESKRKEILVLNLAGFFTWANQTFDRKK